MVARRRAVRPPVRERGSLPVAGGSRGGVYSKGARVDGVRRQEGEGGAPGVFVGLERERLGELQRARILSAMFDVVCERGAQNVSVAHVVERSGVSRRTFYEQFGDLEDCGLAAFEQALADVCERVVPAFEAEGSWRERVRAGLVALLTFLDEQPRLGCVLICESLAAGTRVLERRGEVVAQLTRAIEQAGSQEGRSNKSVPASKLTAEGVVGGVLAVIQARLSKHFRGGESDRGSLLSLTNELMVMIVLPYLGRAAASRELERPLDLSGCVSHHDESLSFDPFKDAGMRLTYRTLRVLLAIAEHPDASNRLIGDQAGVGDQGQTSKLLARLKRIGLIENTIGIPLQGGPNAWRLTQKGQTVRDAIHTRTRSTQA